MEYIYKNPQIFVLSGKAKSGKNYVADKMEEYFNNKKCIQLSYAYYLKQYIKKITNWDGKEDNKPRDLLQSFGIDLIKQQIDKNLLIKRMIEDIKIYSYFYDIIIITDARLIDEIESLKQQFNKVITIRIEKNDLALTEKQNKHITETNLDFYRQFDYIIDGEQLEKETLKFIDMIGSEV